MTPQNIFNPKLEVALDTLVFSDSVLFETSGAIKAITPNVFIYKNDVLEFSPVSFLPNDSIKVAVQSSTEYADQVFAILEIDTGQKVNHVFTCVTLSNVKYVPEFADLEPFELTTYADGSNYVPDNRNNKVTIYKEFDEQPDFQLSNFDTIESMSSFVDETDSYVFSSFYDGKLIRINASSNEISGIIKVPGRPYGVIGVPKIPRINYITDLWVTITDKDKVVVLDNNDDVVREFSVGTRPLGIAADGESEQIYVANSYDDTVTHFKWNVDTSDWDISTLTVGDKPYEVACDTDGSAWITCAADNKVYKITTDDVVTSYTVGNNPRGIAYSSGKMWIAISQEQKVIALNLDGTVAYTLENIGNIPFAVGAVGLPMTFRRNFSDIINITDNVSANRITDTFAFIEAILSNRLSDNIAFADEKLGSDRLADTLSFTDSLNVELTSGEQQEVQTTDSLFRHVNLLITAEDPNPVPATRYLVIELLDYHAGVGGSINELVLLDANGNVIPYTVSSDGAYDLTTNDVPEYWNDHL